MADKLKKQKKFNRIVGIEISENDILAVEIFIFRNTINITGGFRLNIPFLQDIDKTIALLKQSLKVANIKTKECIIGYSMQYFKLFPIPLPTTIPESELDSIVLQESNTDLNNDMVSWIPLNTTKRQEPDGVTRYDILGISIQKQLTDIAKFICQKSNLKPVTVTPSFFGIGSFLNPAPGSALASSLWVSQLRSEFVVWAGQEPIYEHLFLTHQINDQLTQSVNYIQSQLAGAQLATVFTCGSFIKEVNLSLLPFNFQQFLLPQNVIDLKKVLTKVSLNEIITPLGLALAGTNNFTYTVPNLLESISKPQSKGQPTQGIFKERGKTASGESKEIKLPFGIKSLDPQIAKFVTPSIAIFAASIIIAIFIQNFLTPGIEVNQTFFQNKISTAQIQLTKLLNFEKTNKILKLKVEYLSELIDRRKPWSKILKEIGEMTPKGLWIDRLDVRANNIEIFGRALTIDAVANLSINLNYTAKLVSNAQIIALKKFQDDGIDLIEFQVSASVKENNALVTSETKSEKKDGVVQEKSKKEII